MQLNGGGNHTHHHGLLAGLGAGAVAVLGALAVLMLTAYRAVSRTVGQAVPVVVWALVGAALVLAACKIAVEVLRVRHHVLHPETLVPQPVRAEVIQAQPVPVLNGTPLALPAAQPAALMPGRDVILPVDPDEAIAMIRRLAAEGIMTGRQLPR